MLHFTLYCSFLLKVLESKISSISNSSSLSIITGGGGGGICPGNGFLLAGQSNDEWKTSCIFIDAGRSNLQLFPKAFNILYGPIIL